MGYRKTFIFIGIPVIVLFIILHFIMNKNEHSKVYLTFDEILEKNEISGDILSEIIPRSDSIYLIETSGKVSLNLKQLCVIESAAKYNSNHTIYLLMTSPIIQDSNFKTIQREYKNLFVKYLHISSLILESPLEELWKQNIIQQSQYPISHLRADS